MSNKDAALPKGWDTRDAHVIPDPEQPKGFVRMEKIGQAVRGVLRDIWKNKYGAVATFDLTEEPSAPCYHKDPEAEASEAVTVGAGEAVWLNLATVDLQRKVKPHLIGEEIGVQYRADREVQGGTMKLYNVVVFNPELPY